MFVEIAFPAVRCSGNCTAGALYFEHKAVAAVQFTDEPDQTHSVQDILFEEYIDLDASIDCIGDFVLDVAAKLDICLDLYVVNNMDSCSFDVHVVKHRNGVHVVDNVSVRADIKIGGNVWDKVTSGVSDATNGRVQLHPELIV